MNKLVLFLSVLLCLAHAQSIAQQPGSLIWATQNVGGDTIRSIKVQSDGKAVMAIGSWHGSYHAIAVGRYWGTALDYAFGINGVATTFIDSANTTANAVELQSDGKIVAAGSYRKGIVSDFILARYKTDGSPDSSFGTNGIVKTDINAGSVDAAYALAIQPDGKIVAAGQSNSSVGLCRYNTNGSLDSTFNLNGKVTAAGSGNTTSMKLQTDGKIVVCCGSIVSRRMSDGSPDYSFGSGGLVLLTNNFNGMDLQKDGKIVLAGYGSGHDFLVQRLDTLGFTDNSFGNGGLVITNGFYYSGTNLNHTAQWVVVQADGRILAGGWQKYGLSFLNADFIIARYNTNGKPDSSFRGIGQYGEPLYGQAVTHDLSPKAIFSYSGAIGINNDLFVGGTATYCIPCSNIGSALAKYNLGPLLGINPVSSPDRQIVVVPNPAGDFARVQSTHMENGTWHLSLCDLTGKTLHSEMVVVTNNALDKNISLQALPAAMYFIRLDNGISRINVKLTKNR